MDDRCAARTALRQAAGRLAISVVAAAGRGSTILSSFDDALHRCGVSNYNLIPLSSVIPPGAEVARVDRYAAPDEEFGHRLYVVKAVACSVEPGQVIAAGIGWYQWRDGRGVFVEHAATGTSRAAVEAEVEVDLRRSLWDLCSFRGVPFDRRAARCALALAEVADRPSTVLALAVYRSEAWT